jgi:2-polyprenyl-3-methyl-5-hydroxy-6-metoxy-1,4-benzoquinol methylase
LIEGGRQAVETAQLRYNWADPDVYEAFMGRWSEHLASQFLTRVNVAPGGRVLDVACGTGVLTKALAEAGAHVIGVDASEDTCKEPASVDPTQTSHMNTAISGTCGSTTMHSR